VQIVVVQFDIVWQDKTANQEKVRALLAAKTIEENALIVLPEMFDTGFSMQLEATAQTAARESEQFLREIARQNQAAVLAGVVGPVAAGRASNEAVAFAPDGSELVRYRKMQPFTPTGEDQKYDAGTQHRLFAWNGLQIAPFVCYDLRFPEIFRPAALDGAELIVVIANWPEVRSEHWVRLLQARAIENQAFTVGVNRCGSDPSLSYDGRSTAFDPFGVSLFEADGREQVYTVNIDATAARQWRAAFPALQDVRQEFRR
jgi:predicted amidohydrolase